MMSFPYGNVLIAYIDAGGGFFLMYLTRLK